MCNAFSAPGATVDVADPAVVAKAMEPYEELMFEPFSPLTKKVTATVLDKAKKEEFMVAKGAPEIMNYLPGIDAAVEAKAQDVVDR